MTMTCEAVKCYAFKLDDAGNIIGQTSREDDEHEAGEELDRKVKEYAHEHNISYRAALDRVMNAPGGAELVRAYNRAASVLVADDKLADPSVEVARRARTHMQTHECTFVEAASAVLAQDRDLQRAYAGFVGGVN